MLNNCYKKKLQELILLNSAVELLRNVLEDQNIKTQKVSFLYSQKLIERKMKEEKLTLSHGRKLFIAGILKIDDYNELKKENLVNTKNLRKEERDILANLKGIDRKDNIGDGSIVEIFQKISEFDASDKKHLVNLIPPIDIDYKTGDLSLDLNQAFSKILSKKTHRKTNRKNEFHR